MILFLKCTLKITINLGYAAVVLRSQTTLFASAFHALMPPSAVPIKSFCQNKEKYAIITICFSVEHMCRHILYI